MSAEHDREGRARAVAVLCEVEDACAERLVPAPGGHAVLDARHPLLWDANHLRVEDAEAPDPDVLAAAAEACFGALAFRAISVLDEAVGDALAAPLLARGYRVEHQLLMLLGASLPPRDTSIAIDEVERAAIASSRAAAARQDTRLDAEVGAQLVSRDALIGAAVAERCFAVLDGDVLAARCRLYVADGVAQIEHVYTAPACRSRGLARALVAHAAGEARAAAGAEVVFLVADADGWPQQLYRRLGFAGAGLLPRFRQSL